MSFQQEVRDAVEVLGVPGDNAREQVAVAGGDQGHCIGIDEGHRRVQERCAAGLLDIDDDSIVAALTAPLPHFVDELDGLEVPTWHELLRLCSAPGAAANS
ncbi:hypothetical protein QQY66_28495 [Streptomyces sp. DG2A-72]|uniref:hypothetical protein n=1 Tax=Streptomyces sp. DG2A-72 TaxID=3051386 RepID=UPI00265C65AE|nr:hypothetical protein [Streptomyces sp. DG2A-72]MDO0935417.1 hypothetical protein [Streptomyces sp. DG2A-72]